MCGRALHQRSQSLVSEVLLPVHFEPHPSSAHGLKMHCGLPQVLAKSLTNSINESP